MENVEVIEIEWEGPLSCQEALKKSEAWDYGVYQIYGTHNVLGPETLLYIGKAQERSFSVRISEHLTKWIRWEPSGVRVYLGRLGGETTMPDLEWTERIERAERLLIHFCTPPYNSQGLTWFGEVSPTIVRNFRQRNRLPLEVSTLYDKWPTPDWKVYGR